MNFSRVLLFGSALLLISACGNYGRGGPDGGSNRQVCEEGISTLGVLVKDGTGAPVKDATVTARHTGTGTTVTSKTNAQGSATAINAELGSGTIQLHATLDTRTSNTVQVEWICGECACTATPSQPVLTLP